MEDNSISEDDFSMKDNFDRKENIGQKSFWDIPHVRNTVIKFYSKINEYFDNGKYTDVSITCQDRVFKCHRLVLAANSEYFDAMFGGSFEESLVQDVVLHDIDNTAFELALCYMYKGEVPIIEDKNVCGLLRAAGILNLDCVEERCIHYLSEKHVPTDFALEIFVYACVIKSRPLLSCTSQCILENLSHFSESTEFLSLSFEELSTLLEFGLPDGSTKRENILLRAIHQWVSNLTCSNEEKKSSFQKLTEHIRFRINPVEFFDKFNQAELQKACDRDLEIRNCDSTLHAFVTSSRNEVQTYLYTYNEQEKELNHSLGWHETGNLGSAIDYMRTVVIDNRLYCLQLQGQQFSFISSSSVDLSADTQSLALPPFATSQIDTAPNFYLCSHKNNIYACSKYRSNSLFNYNCKLNQWFDIPLNTSEVSSSFSPGLITSCHNQLYMIGEGTRGREARTYDCQTGKLNVLSKPKLNYFDHNEICHHKDKIYVSSITYSKYMETYNPVANKWNIILEKTPNNREMFSWSHRIASFKNELLMFTVLYCRELSFSNMQSIMIHNYNSLTEEWTDDKMNHLSSAISYKHPQYNSDHVITDVIVCDPL